MLNINKYPRLIAAIMHIFFRLQQQNHSSAVSFYFRLKEIKKNCLLFAYFVFFFICINKLPFKFKTLSLQYVRIIRIIHFYSVTLLCSCISFLLWFFSFFQVFIATLIAKFYSTLWEEFSIRLWKSLAVQMAMNKY